MKVYIALNNPWEEPNPYTYTLLDGILSKYHNFSVEYGIEKFWSGVDLLCFDIVHIMFPDWLCRGHSSEEFAEQLISIKKKNIKIVTTCHNLHSHSWIEDPSYDIAYSFSDCIIHLGQYSYELLSVKFPSTKHVIISHHTYDRVYTNIPSRDEAIKRLRLSPKRRYVLSFGSFRNEEERKIVAYVANHLKRMRVCFIAPTFVRTYHRRNPRYWLPQLLHFWRYKIKAHNLISICDVVSDELLPYYYAVSDVTFIQRLDILNSGSLPMGFFMKHVVVGPDLGNVGAILRETGNPVFDIADWKSAINAVSEALDIYEKGKGIENYSYAMHNMSTDKVSSNLYNCYKSLIIDNE